MKVRELIEILQEINQEFEVIKWSDNYFWPIDGLRIYKRDMRGELVNDSKIAHFSPELDAYYGTAKGAVSFNSDWI